MLTLQSLGGLLLATITAGLLAACSASPDGAATGDEEDVKELKTLYGDSSQVSPCGTS